MNDVAIDKIKLLRKITIKRYLAGVCFGYPAGSALYSLLIRNFDNNTAVSIDFVIKIGLIIVAVVLMINANKAEKELLK